eukprot:gnl/TRDRNA2_/TRDRNA2_155150_c6_seq1.p1 gnl/TRDRNA2_/TRDRNA2_155150_c6~~gnl/TRDRNA2_/TRDRNA2_155150_c6_seq1.p1  ORF type:complete len:723 (-),score=173.01 gnl/TRDRNA2_/TRDRNA2_155150_c6_seq1:89-2038(-)
MFSEHLAWRKEAGVNRVADGYFDVGPPHLYFPEMSSIRRFYPHGFHGTDRRGRPVYIERLGALDLPNLLTSTSHERILEYFTHECERQTTYRLVACSLAKKGLVEQSMNILDLQDLRFSTVTHATARKTLQALTKVQQNHYPEMMGQMVIVNAPRIFNIAWSFVKPMIDAKTVQKIQIFGNEPDVFGPRLCEFIDPRHLPSFLGGECKCAGGCIGSDIGPWKDPQILEELAARPHWDIWRQFAAEVVQRPRSSPTSSESAVQPASPLSPLAPAAATVGEPAGAVSPGRARASSGSADDQSPTSSTKLRQELKELEDLYVQTLEKWLVKSASLMKSIGVRQIERAQRYFDSLTVLQHSQANVNVLAAEFRTLMEEHTLQATFLDQAEAELQAAKAEMAKKRPQHIDSIHEPDPVFVAHMKKVTDLTEVVTELTDKVTSVESRRDAMHAEYGGAMAALRRAQARVETLEKEHENCGWNCSVIAAQPYFEERRCYEEVLEIQVQRMDELRAALAAAEERAAAAAKDEAREPLVAANAEVANDVSHASAGDTGPSSIAEPASQGAESSGASSSKRSGGGFATPKGAQLTFSDFELKGPQVPASETATRSPPAVSKRTEDQSAEEDLLQCQECAAGPVVMPSQEDDGFYSCDED